MLGSRPRVRNRSAAHSAEWQDLELIFRQLLQHRIMRESREGSSVCITYCRSAETFMHACLRPTEAACFCVQKCANNHQLIVAGVQRFLRHTCTAHFCIVYAKAVCPMYIYANIDWHIFKHRNGNTHVCLT